MRYTSTRDPSVNVSFTEAIFTGLPPDGGLYVPTAIPTLTITGRPTFLSLCFNIFRAFIDPTEIPDHDLQGLIKASYASFRHPDVTPLAGPLTVRDRELYVLELFHGPTFAFKDVALQFLGNVLAYLWPRYLKTKDKNHSKTLLVVGATSGDTGSAAIHALRDKPHVKVAMLYPDGRVSQVQERQMTTVHDENVYCVKVDGDFDDCQFLVKALLRDQEIRKTAHVTGVNSVNWCRIMAQIVYYYYSYHQLRTPSGPVTFVVPTGNFGDILAGIYAQRLGLPIRQLLLATNANDVLHVFLASPDGSYGFRKTAVQATMSPAMDISLPSNFERALWMWGGSENVNVWMRELAEAGGTVCGKEVVDKARENLTSGRVSDEETLAMVREVYDMRSYLMCPHTAVGVHAALTHDPPLSDPVICLATAHPAKFIDAIAASLGHTAFSHPLLTAPQPSNQDAESEQRDECRYRDLTERMNPGSLTRMFREASREPFKLRGPGKDQKLEGFKQFLREVVRP